MKLANVFLCWIVFAWLLLDTIAGRAQSTSFTFTLDEPCKTSAGVFAPNGALIRTLWSKVRYYAPGTYSAVWDGLDDNSNAAPAGVYQIRLLQHNTEYVWDGTVGNTSAEISGPTVHVGFWPMADMAISGTNAFYVSGYDEGKYDFRNFLTTDPQHVKMAWYWVYTAQFNRVASFPGDVNDLNWLWVAADSNWVYFACSGTPNPTNTAVPNAYPGCIVACNVADNSPAYFTDGVQIVNHGANSPLPSGIYVGTQPGLSGMAVQQNGNLLAVSVAPDNTVYLVDKRAGAPIAHFNVPSPGRLSFSPDGSLWVISGNNVLRYTNLNSTPSVALTVSDFSEPLDVAVNPTNANLILVADGGASQQVKALNSAGTPLWTYGLAGGYQTNGVAVGTNKFWFTDGENDETFLCFAPDGSFWVGDGGNNRAMHFSAACNYIEQIMYEPHSYITAVAQNNPSRVFNQFLEFSVDYTKPLPQGWTLVNNWKANVPPVNVSWNQGLYEVTTFPNGRTYALIDNNSSTFAMSELCELTTNQLRLTGLYPAYSAANRGWISLGPDGSARRTTIGAATWFESTLNGFDANNNPIWNPESMIASASEGSTDPVPRGSSFGNIRATISSNNILISFDQSLNNGWHLGGINVGSSTWLWKASPAVAYMNGRGTYEIANGVTYGGNTVQAVDRNVIYGYHGEFFRGQGQAGQIMHFYDDGLFVGQFGEASPGHSAYEGALPGFAGNGQCPNLTKTASGDYYLWVNDESDHGPQRWHFVNARNIREQTGSGPLGGAITITNQACGFPVGVAGQNGNQSGALTWQPVQGATSYNIRYSLINGGPFSVVAGNTTNLSYVVGSLTNGQTYYFAVTAIQAGVEGIPSEQVPIYPFDTTQNVLRAGSMSEGGQFTPVVEISSSALASGQPSYIGAEHYTAVLDLRELDYYGYGNLENETVGAQGYTIFDWGGPGASLTNIPAPFTVTPGAGWYDIPYLQRQYRVDNVLGAANGWLAGPTASINIGVGDTNFHFLTVVSPAQFNNARVCTIRLTSTNNTSAVFTLNENPGLSHVFQFLFRGNVTLWADASGAGGSDAIVEALFLDNAAVTYSAGTTNSPIPIPTASTTTLASSQNPALTGSLVTFTATVSGIDGIPTGTVAFFDGSNNLGASSLNGSGVAAFSTTSALSVGGSPHAITAAYSGDNVFSASVSSVLSQVITNAGTNSPTNAPAGLAARWPFAEGSGMTTADSSGNGNTGTLIASPQWVAGFAGSNYALEFPGAAYPGAAYVSAPSSATLADQGLGSNITICAWVKRSSASVGNYCSVVAKDVLADSSPYHRNYELIFDTANHILFVYRNSAGTTWEKYSSTTTYTDTANWHFYCVTYTYGSASSCALYVDGFAVSGNWVSGNGSDAPASTSGGPVLIGMDGTGTCCNGSLYDQISIYNVALSASQIGALYVGGSSGGIASATTLASSQNPAPDGGDVTLTATVSGGGGVPTGTVAFFDSGANLGDGTLNSSGVATFGTSALSTADSPHVITAVYSGNSAYAGSASSALSQIITNSGDNGPLWQLSQQPALTDIAIAVFRPTTANSVMVVNEMPNGSPSDTGNGIVWHDWCLEDCFATEPLIHVIHAATHRTFMEVSSQVYNGANPLPLCFGQGFGPAPVTTFAAGISNYVFYASGGLGGVTDGSSALTGRVGEFVSGAVGAASAIYLVSGTPTNVASIVLSAGDWDVEGVASFDVLSGMVSSSAGGISTSSATVPADGSMVASGLQLTASSALNSITIPRKQIDVSSTTTVYLVGTCKFNAGGVSAFGQLVARRMR